jgi:hypothetical protein
MQNTAAFGRLFCERMVFVAFGDDGVQSLVSGGFGLHGDVGRLRDA